MPTPPMLRPREAPRTSFSPPSDAVAALTVLLLCVCAAGLFVAGILAVYDYSTPGSERPLLLGLTVIVGAALLLNISVATFRHFSRR